MNSENYLINEYDSISIEEKEFEEFYHIHLNDIYNYFCKKELNITYLELVLLIYKMTIIPKNNRQIKTYYHNLYFKNI